MRETLLLSIDVGPAGAIFRAALGAAFVLVLRPLLAGAGLGAAAAVLAVMLFGVKAVAAVARRVVPATPVVRAHQEWRRNLARFHDSYQWRKLFWVGSGILGMAAAGPQGSWEVPLGVACVLSGAAAEIVWRRKGLSSAPLVRVRLGGPRSGQESGV